MHPAACLTPADKADNHVCSLDRNHQIQFGTPRAVGADTAERLCRPKYYSDDELCMLHGARGNR